MYFIISCVWSFGNYYENWFREMSFILIILGKLSRILYHIFPQTLCWKLISRPVLWALNSLIGKAKYWIQESWLLLLSIWSHCHSVWAPITTQCQVTGKQSRHSVDQSSSEERNRFNEFLAQDWASLPPLQSSLIIVLLLEHSELNIRLKNFTDLWIWTEIHMALMISKPFCLT